MEELGKQRGVLARIARSVRFDMPDVAFELLETESGEPPFLTEWSRTDGKRKQSAKPEKSDRVSPHIKENRARFEREYRSAINPDLILRTFMVGGKIKALAVFLNGMADGDQINDFILKPSMREGCMARAGKRLAAFAAENVFSMQEAELTENWADVKIAVEEGRTAVFLEGDVYAVLMDTRGFASRSVGTPQNEVVILGPHEAFTENIRTNVTLLRRIVKTDDFVCEFRKSGGQNGTRLAILYREGVANRRLVNEVKRRLAHIDTLAVLSSGTVEQLTESHPYAPLPQTLTTERPDRVAAGVMNGRVAVLCEGSPLANVMPATLFDIMSSGEDAYLRQPIGTIIRIVRYAGTLISVITPAYFLALAMHHQGMLSSEVLATVIASRNMVFLSLPLELLFLLFVFQLVRQASISAPGAMGQSIGIIGGLILGQSAVSANVVSKLVLVLVALSGLGNFCVPDYNTQIATSYFRILLVLFAWVGGLLGLTAALLVSGALIAGMKSYGVPYLAPLAPRTKTKGPMLYRGRVRMDRRPADFMNTEGGDA